MRFHIISRLFGDINGCTTILDQALSRKIIQYSTITASTATAKFKPIASKHELGYSKLQPCPFQWG